MCDHMAIACNWYHDCACPRLILRLLNQQQVAQTYDVFWPLDCLQSVILLLLSQF
jgi:hypothetical protein